jgi:hypothetical protein
VFAIISGHVRTLTWVDPRPNSWRAAGLRGVSWGPAAVDDRQVGFRFRDIGGGWPCRVSRPHRCPHADLGRSAADEAPETAFVFAIIVRAAVVPAMGATPRRPMPVVTRRVARVTGGKTATLMLSGAG